MTLDPESASLLVQAQREAKRQGDLSLSVDAPSRDRADVSLSVGETRRESWGEWFWRVSGRATVQADRKPDLGGQANLGMRWFRRQK